MKTVNYYEIRVELNLDDTFTFTVFELSKPSEGAKRTKEIYRTSNPQLLGEFVKGLR